MSSTVSHNAHDRPSIAGNVMPGFEQVRIEFERNFLDRGEQGAACTIYHHGVKVVDLWGGYRCHKTREPWSEQTLSLAFSVTKGMAAAVMAVAHSRGLFDLDEAVASYWPEFAQGGKRQITVRQLLAHQAGLIAVERQLDPQQLANHDLMAEIIAKEKPLWHPGTRHGYHTLTLGWYQSELIRRIDPQHRSLGHFFQEELADPLGIEFYIGLPPSIAPERISTIRGFHRLAILRHFYQLPPRMVLTGIWPRSLVARSARILKINNPADLDGPEYRSVEIPSANGIGQARAIARVYEVLSRGGTELGIKPSTWQELIAPAIAPQLGTDDAILKTDTRYSFGFSRPSASFRFGVDGSAFGTPGAGGSLGMADPTKQLGFAYLTNTMGFRLFDDPREKAVRDACYATLATIRNRPMAA